eukprot:1157239-Pelagomonas_calceolata.AAC.14
MPAVDVLQINVQRTTSPHVLTLLRPSHWCPLPWLGSSLQLFSSEIIQAGPVLHYARRREANLLNTTATTWQVHPDEGEREDVGAFSVLSDDGDLCDDDKKNSY